MKVTVGVGSGLNVLHSTYRLLEITEVFIPLDGFCLVTQHSISHTKAGLWPVFLTTK